MYYKIVFFIGLLSLALLFGCEETTEESVSNIVISADDAKVIEKYLTEEIMTPNFGGAVFAEYEILETENDVEEIYLWALIQEYYQKGEVIEEGSGMSVPIVLSVRKESQSTKIVSHSLPRDGSYFTDDIKEMFPRHIQNKIFEYGSEHISKLIKDLEEKVKESY
ncbi:hypothetical protein [Evansella cellulosilytica]|uniref:Uncharacterized protein n=1 Tax=Evansella cellulosilytica (strain ATCC 21833 / DSM 2522 / FERM P-1141 / JCM 9156 / N-4) TaxID=649639 RepID=E6U0S3_EVAC2|nr:hypothetical protein [Evansella cellulosilytica]ADU29121.1 hypothetical protein Bcell_0843 [Evansella cellulosilytica DSM 2522]